MAFSALAILPDSIFMPGLNYPCEKETAAAISLPIIAEWKSIKSMLKPESENLALKNNITPKAYSN